MNFEVRDVITPMVDFIKTCPFAEEFGVDISDIHIQNLDEGDYEGSSIEYAGSSMLSQSEDVLGETYIERHANFNLWLVVKDGHNFRRKDTANFLFNFEHWIEFSRVMGLVPKLSMFEEDEESEMAFASNGSFYSKYGESDLSLYMIQIGILYKNKY